MATYEYADAESVKESILSKLKTQPWENEAYSIEMSLKDKKDTMEVINELEECISTQKSNHIPLCCLTGDRYRSDWKNITIIIKDVNEQKKLKEAIKEYLPKNPVRSATKYAPTAILSTTSLVANGFLAVELASYIFSGEFFTPVFFGFVWTFGVLGYVSTQYKKRMNLERMIVTDRIEKID